MIFFYFMNKFINLAKIVFVFVALTSVANANLVSDGELSREVSIPTEREDVLSGQIDYLNPQNPQKKNGVLVVLVHGSGQGDRHYKYGNSNTSSDYLFDYLSSLLLSNGYDILRYDGRNSYCIPNASTCKKPSYLYTSLVDDVIAVFRYARTQVMEEKKCIIALTFSEGGNVFLDAAQKEPLLADGLLAISPVMQSRSEVAEWQMVNQLSEMIYSSDADQDGVVSERELNDAWPKSSLEGEGLPLYLFKNGYLNKERLVAFERNMSRLHAENLSRLKGSAEMTPVVNWLLDDRESAIMFSRLSIPKIFLYGEEDLKINSIRQIEVGLKYNGSRFDIQVFPDVGHTLGRHLVLGPPTDESRTRIRNAIEALYSNTPNCANLADN